MPTTVRIIPFGQTTEGQLNKRCLMPRRINTKQGHFSFAHLCVQNDTAEQPCGFQFFKTGIIDLPWELLKNSQYYNLAVIKIPELKVDQIISLFLHIGS